MDEEKIILSGNEEELAPIITLLVALKQMIGSSSPPVYGIPIDTFQSRYTFLPQVFLWFTQDKNEVPDGERALEGEISFKLVKYTSESITSEYIKSLAQRVKSKFGNSGGFVWNKGKTRVTYFDKSLGYDFRVNCRDEAEGYRIIEQVLDLQGHSPKEELFSVNEAKAPSKKYPDRPDRRLILGQTRRLPRRRPLARVRFRYALLHLWGVPQPVCLLDLTGRFAEPVITS